MNWLTGLITATRDELRSLLAPAAPAQTAPHRLDTAVTLLFLAAAWLLYGALAYRLAQGRYLDYWNLGFDFDPTRLVETLAEPVPDKYGFKHPLILLWRPFAQPFLALGLTAKQSAGLLVALMGAGSVAMVFRLFRAIGIEIATAAALTLLFATTGAQVFNSVIVDTYAPASFSLAFVWTVAAARLADPARFRRMHYLAGLIAFGTTITNVAQAGIAELVVIWRASNLGNAIRRGLAFGIVLLLLAVPLILAVWWRELLEAAADPIRALKTVYWLRTHGERTGIGPVLFTFFGLTAVSPDYTWMMLPEGINMRDFREYRFISTGALAMPLWLAFLATGTIAGLANRNYRWLAFGALLSMVFNVALHMDFQYRGSLYLYAAHGNLAVFILAAGLAPWAAASRLRLAYLACVLLLTVLVGIDNLTIAADFVADFDVVNVPCPAPCAGGPQ